MRRYNNLSRWQALKQAVETSAYIFVIWFPIAFYIIFKIIFKPKDMNWGKTTHGLILEEAKKEKVAI